MGGVNVVTAKEYLSRLQFMKNRINWLLEQRNIYLDKASSTTAPVNTMKVQSSRIDDKMGDNIAKAVDIQQQINEDVYSFLLEKHRVIDQIQTLNNVKYIHILFERYIQGKTLKNIAKDTGWSYQYIKQLHINALKKFEEIHGELLSSESRKGD
jgi:DNA-directed RNA polymerase specialized sigma subunit